MEQKKVLRGPFKNEFENPFYFAFRIALIERERERMQRREIKYEREKIGQRKSEDKGRIRMRKRYEGEKPKEIYKVRE